MKQVLQYPTPNVTPQYITSPVKLKEYPFEKNLTEFSKLKLYKKTDILLGIYSSDEPTYIIAMLKSYEYNQSIYLPLDDNGNCALHYCASYGINK